MSSVSKQVGLHPSKREPVLLPAAALCLAPGDPPSSGTAFQEEIILLYTKFRHDPTHIQDQMTSEMFGCILKEGSVIKYLHCMQKVSNPWHLQLKRMR